MASHHPGCAFPRCVGDGAVGLAFGAERDAAVVERVTTFERLADEGLRMTAQHLGDLTGPRRHAVLCATVIKLESVLTDAALSMFDKLMGSVARKAARRFDERTLQSAREVRARIQSLTKACRAVIAARDNGSDPFAAVDRDVGWQEFLRAVAEAEAFAAPAVEGDKSELIGTL
jgi:hypothetical protein